MIRAPPDRIPGSLREIEDGTLEVSSGREVHRQPGRDLAGPLTVARLLPVADATVQSHPARGSHLLIEDLPVEGVPEGEAPAHRSVGPLGDARLTEKMAFPCEFLTHGLDGV